ncbi:MAG: RNA polymerase sigma factor [Bacillota bacterium]|jgi:RNA polymerase sigma-70 factor (ECF subfamily)
MDRTADDSSGTAPAQDEGRLIERIREGDAQAFGELVRRYQRRAFAIAYRLLRHIQDAEDLVQESFITALDRLDSFDVRRPFGPWFFRIVVNRGRNAIAARRVRETDALDDEVVSGGASPDRLVEQRELGDRLGLALDELSDRQRLVVQLHEIEGFTTAEVAGMLEIAEPTVRWTLHAARKRLRVELAGWKEQHDE